MSEFSWPSVHADATVRFRPLNIVRHGSQPPLLGCPELRRFLEIDEEGAAVVELLQRGRTIKQTEQLLEIRFGHECDVLAFLESLASKGFIEQIGERVLETSETKLSHTLLSRVPVRRLGSLHSPILTWTVVAVLLIWIALVIKEPTLFPSPQDIRATDNAITTLVLAFVGMLGMAYLHELAHFFVARSYGIEPLIRFSHRFLVLVLQTDVTNAWGLPARQRLRIFLAGPALNITVLAVMGILSFAAPALHWSVQTVRWLRFVAYVNFFPLLFQLMIFGRTDLYFVLLTLLKERNLARDSRRYLWYRTRRLALRLRSAPKLSCTHCSFMHFPDDPYCLRCHTLRDVADPTRWPFRPEARIRLAVFGTIQVLGQGLMMTFAMTFGLITQMIFINYGIHVSIHDLAAHDYRKLVESVIFLILLSLQLSMLLYFLARGVKSAIAPLLTKFKRNRQVRAIVE